MRSREGVWRMFKLDARQACLFDFAPPPSGGTGARLRLPASCMAAAPQFSSRRRVKVYHLVEDGQWEDKGTGYVQCVYSEKFDGAAIVVTAEDEPRRVILEAKIYVEDIYQCQQDTLIVWSDPMSGRDFALSFQEHAGCSDIWYSAASISRALVHVLVPRQQIHGIQQRLSESSAFGVPYSGNAAEEKFHYSDSSMELPPAEPENLRKIAEAFSEQSNSSFQKESVLAALTQTGYLKRLLDLFHRCEAARNMEALHMLWNVFKSLVLMNHPPLLEVLFSEDNALQVMGVLEYDPAFPVKHREYLTTRVLFKEVVAFRNANVVRRIHQAFRFQYLKDVVLPRQLDDATFATINSLIYFNNMEIVAHIQGDDRFLSDLFRKLKANDTTAEDRLALVLFLQELCSLTKNMQVQGKNLFYRSLVEHGLCDIFRLTLPDPNVTVRSCSTEILGHLLATDASILRSYILSQPPEYRLLHAILRQMIDDPELGIKIQLVEIVRMLIDTSPPVPTAGGAPPAPLEVASNTHSADKEDFLNIFYSQCMNELVSPFNAPDDPSATARLTAAEREVLGATKNHVCELLSFCLQHHGYRIKSFVLGNNIAHKVLKKLMHEKETYLLLAGVRFFRAFIGQKDEFYTRHIIKMTLFDPIIQAFRTNGDRYNLLQSAIVELFEFLLKESQHVLIGHLAERYEAEMRAIDYVDTFRKLLLKHYQHREFLADARRTQPLPTSEASGAASGTAKRRAVDEDDDEAYFNTSDEEPVPAALRSSSGSTASHASNNSTASVGERSFASLGIAPGGERAGAAGGDTGAAPAPAPLVRAPSRMASWEAPARSFAITPTPAAAGSAVLTPSSAAAAASAAASSAGEHLIKRRRSADSLPGNDVHERQPQQQPQQPQSTMNHSVLPIE